MTVLTEAEIRDQFKPSKSEVDKYFKNHPRLKRTKATVRKVRERIRASKIVRAPGKEVSFTQSAAEWQIIYGTHKVGGVITFVANGGANNEVLHIVVTVAGHEINQILKLYLDDEEVIFGASPDPRWATGIQRKDGTVAAATNKIFMSVSTGDTEQPANADLVGQQPTLWTSEHKQAGCAHAYLILVWDAILFPNGVPQITFLVEGKKVGIPDGSVPFTSNAAAVIRDFLIDVRYGMHIPSSQIDATQFETAYNICNEDVEIIGGGTEKRYTIDGVFKASESPSEILEAMCAAMGGTVTFVNGKWKIYPAAYISPTLTLTEDDILSDIRIQTKFARSESFNGVRGTFVSPSNGWEETDFPRVKNDYYKTLDNDELMWEDIQLPLTNSPARCQRLAKIELERNRQSLTLQFTASLKAYQLQPMDTVYLTIARYGWSQKVFEVQEVTLVQEGGGDAEPPSIRVELLLRETASGIYDWNSGEETAYDLAPNTNLPNPLYVPPITSLTLSSGTAQLYVRKDGTIFSRIEATWDQPDDFFVTSGGKIEIQYKRSNAASWISMTDTPGDLSAAFILDVQDSIDYDVRVRARNSLGVTGEWATVTGHTVIGKTAPPSNVENFQGSIESFGIRFTWSQVPDLDVRSYEIRVGVLGSTWDEADFLTLVSGTTHSANIRAASDYQFYIKAVDTSGNYSLEATTLYSTIVGPGEPDITIQLVEENYLLKWTPATETLFAVSAYEIAYGEAGSLYADRTVVTQTRGLSFSEAVRWGGTRVFWVTGIDVAGNYGTPGLVTLDVESPTVVNGLTTQILDQNVLLRWQSPTRHSLPIASYYVYKGDALESAYLIGDLKGTFAPLFEIVGGTYSYWVRAVDSAGNLGTAKKTTAIIQPPADFVLLQTGDPDNGAAYIDPSTGTGVRFSDEDDQLIMPINATETWDEHFSAHGFTTTQDAVDAGLSYLIQPVPLSAYWTRTLDYLEDSDVLIEGAMVTFEFSKEFYDGVPTVTTFIGYSADGVEWVTVEGQQAFAHNFRYIRITIQVGSIGGESGEAMGNIGLTYP